MQPEPISSNSFNSPFSGSLSTKDLDPLVKLISTRLGVSEFTAFTVLRKFMGTAHASTFTDINNFVTDFLKEGNTRQVTELAKDLQALEQNPNTNESSYKPILTRLAYGLSEAKAQQARLNGQVNSQNILEQDRFFATNQARVANTNPATQLVQSPKLFASWLVNNKAAFIALKSHPEAMNLLLALQNPEISKSPILLSQISVLIAQLLKLKAGKSLTEDVDEVKKEEGNQEIAIEALDHESDIVNTVKQTTMANTVEGLRDFLLEAERFAEEEIANLWSLTLKKEKELEKKFKEGFKKFKE